MKWDTRSFAKGGVLLEDWLNLNIKGDEKMSFGVAEDRVSTDTTTGPDTRPLISRWQTGKGSNASRQGQYVRGRGCNVTDTTKPRENPKRKNENEIGSIGKE